LLPGSGARPQAAFRRGKLPRMFPNEVPDNHQVDTE
jgi:hypothetical protein